jgi:V/A-type H+-transporting ATPase subunit E
MAGAEKIRLEILEEARLQAKANLERAEKEAREVLEAAGEEAERKQEKLLEKAAGEAEERRKRMLAIAELEGRKKRLQAKQEVLEEVFEKTLASLNTMPAKQYEQILSDMIINVVTTGMEEIVLAKKDRELLGATLVNNINQRLVSAGRTGSLKLSAEAGDFNGGFILKSGDVEINQSFDTVLRMQHDELETLAIKVLFG